MSRNSPSTKRIEKEVRQLLKRGVPVRRRKQFVSDAPVNLVASVIRDTFLASAAWRELRKRVLATYGRRCMCCGYAPPNRNRINVDHIKPRALFPELALDFRNLQVLCARCNQRKGNKHMIDYRPKFVPAVAMEPA